MKKLSAEDRAAKGYALSLRELGAVSGYDRKLLAQMHLPLVTGKISLPDFSRVMHQRQDALEAERLALHSPPLPPAPRVVMPDVDLFRAPRAVRSNRATSGRR